MEDRTEPNEQVVFDADITERDYDNELFEEEVLAVEAPDEEVYGSVSRQPNASH